MEKKTYKETVVVTQADNGIVWDSLWEDNGEHRVSLMLDEDKVKNIGEQMLDSIEHVMDCNCANRVKIEITYTFLED